MPGEGPQLPARPEGVRIAIHPRPGSFSTRLADLCEETGIAFSLIDGYGDAVVSSLREHSHLLWHFDHEDPRDQLVAPLVLETASQMGLVVFPDHDTRWHFDDKIAQKYLLESKGLPVAKTSVFYTEHSALSHCASIDYPVVAKLRSGAGSANVRLIRSGPEARRYIKTMFRGGLQPVPAYTDDLQSKLRRIHTYAELLTKLGRLPDRLVHRYQIRKNTPLERGYVLFQEFLPGALFDTRITVIGDHAWSFRRGVRPGDFRASGSGNIWYDPTQIDPDCIALGFRAARALGMQSCAIDLVHDQAGSPRIIEVSYGFLPSAVHGAPGRWHISGAWEAGHFHPEDSILAALLSPSRAADSRVR